MKLVSGNKAILEHAQSGKAIHVFEYTRKAYVRYIGSADCVGYHEEIRPDRIGNDRVAFIFHLDINSIETENRVLESRPIYGSKDVKDLKKKTIKELREAALIPSPRNVSAKQKREIAYYRSQALKLYVIERSKGKCEGCKCNAPFQTKSGPFLECHHVHRLADGGPDHPKNVVALCPNCHRRAHYAEDAENFNNILKEVAIEAEQNAL